MKESSPLPRGELLLGLSLAAVSAFSYAMLPLLVKAAYSRGATPLSLLTLRFLFALPLFWGTALSLRLRDLRVGWRRGILFLSVGLLFGLASICMFHAYREVSASLAVIILYTYPPLVALWGRLFFGERLSAVRLLALAAAFVGVALTVGSMAAGTGSRPLLGLSLSMAAALLYSFYSLAAERFVAGAGPLVFTSYSVTATFILMAGITSPVAAVRRSGWEVIAIAGAIALVPTFLAIYTFARSIRHIGATRASVVSNLEPVGVVALSALFLGERLTPAQLAGGVLILGGVYLLRLGPHDRGEPGGAT